MSSSFIDWIGKWSVYYTGWKILEKWLDNYLYMVDFEEAMFDDTGGYTNQLYFLCGCHLYTPLCICI